MKYLFFTQVLAILFLSCKETTSAKPVQQESMPVTSHKKDFSGVVFAVKKDLSCGMPLTAGLTDTAVYQGKYYGFCSPECKADFEKNAAAYIKKKK